MHKTFFIIMVITIKGHFQGQNVGINQKRCKFKNNAKMATRPEKRRSILRFKLDKTQVFRWIRLIR